MDKAPDAFRTISEVADDLDIPQHVLRFWETRFAQIKPMKRGGGRRYYRPTDVDLLRGIKHLLYGEGYTIKGVQRILREEGIKHVQSVWQDEAGEPEVAAVTEAPMAPAPDQSVEPVAEARREPAVTMAPAQRRPAVASFVEDAGEADDNGEPPASAPSLAAEQRRLLQSALAELKQCRRALKSATETAR